MVGDLMLLAISTAAKRLRISPGTLLGYAEKGIVPVIMLPSGYHRFKAEDIQRLCRINSIWPA